MADKQHTAYAIARRWQASGNLLVLDVSSDDACVITCKAENQDGITQASATLTVIGTGYLFLEFAILLYIF